MTDRAAQYIIKVVGPLSLIVGCELLIGGIGLLVGGGMR